MKGKRILLVEDNEINRLLANTILTQYGADITEAANGDIAINILGDNSFDLILMDVQMPVKGGIETTMYIRSHIDTSIPIIALTANAFKSEEVKCLQAGMNDFITKPFDEHKIVSVVTQWLGREVDIPVTVNEKLAENRKLIDLGLLESVSRGKKDFVKKMLDLFIESTPAMFNEMQQSHKEQDWKNLRALAHRMKASVHVLGITAIDQNLDGIEYSDNDEPDKDEIDEHMHRIKFVLSELKREIKAFFK